MSRRAVPLACQWSGCPLEGVTVDSAEDLVSHVNVTHIESFSGQDVVLCLWGGCKVYNVPSSSYRWLKQHVQQVHMKERPHKCFMNGCNMSFHSVEALQRHLQKHLEPTLPKSPKSAKASPVSKMKVLATKIEKAPSTTESDIKPKVASLPPPLIHVPRDEEAPPPKKLCIEGNAGSGSEVSVSGSGVEGRKKIQTQAERRGSALPFRRRRQSSLKVSISRYALLSHSTQGQLPSNGQQPWAHIHSEILDHKTMSVIRQTSIHLAITDCSHGCNCITLTAKVLGKRKCTGAAECELLVRWMPSLLADSWVPLSKFQEKRVVPFKQMTCHQLSELATTCFGFSKVRNRLKKRKP